MRRFLTVPTAILTVVLLIAGCTSSDDTADDETTIAAPATTVAPPETATTAASTTSTTLSETAAIATAEALQEALNEKNLVYATWESGSLTLDMHVPAEPGAAPIVVYLPGRGSPGAPSWLVEGLVEEGAIMFVVRYARGHAGGYSILSDHGAAARAMAESVACAIHFAREQALELGSDDQHVVLTGFSLGGGVAVHAALFGTTLEARWDEYGAEGGPPHQVECEVTDGSTHVDAVVGMSGRYDVFVPTYEGKFGSTYQQERDPELWEFLSSSIGASPDLTVRLIHGESDNAIPYENSTEFATVLTDAGYDVGEVVAFEGGHWVSTEFAIPTIMEVTGP
jgi:predicted esterase